MSGVKRELEALRRRDLALTRKTRTRTYQFSSFSRALAQKTLVQIRELVPVLLQHARRNHASAFDLSNARVDVRRTEDYQNAACGGGTICGRLRENVSGDSATCNWTVSRIVLFDLNYTHIVVRMQK